MDRQWYCKRGLEWDHKPRAKRKPTSFLFVSHETSLIIWIGKPETVIRRKLREEGCQVGAKHWLGGSGRRGKDDRKQNTKVAPLSGRLPFYLLIILCSIHTWSFTLPPAEYFSLVLYN
jgi:hypothetical protein